MAIQAQKVVYAIIKHDLEYESIARDTTIDVVSVHESLRRANHVMIKYIATLHPDLCKSIGDLDRDLSREEEFFGNKEQGNWIRHDGGKLDFMRTDCGTLNDVLGSVAMRMFVLETPFWESRLAYKPVVEEEDSGTDAEESTDDDTDSNEERKKKMKIVKSKTVEGDDKENPVGIGWDHEDIGRPKAIANLLKRKAPKRVELDAQGTIKLGNPKRSLRSCSSLGSR